MQRQEHLPDVGVSVGEHRTNKAIRDVACDLVDLKQMIAEWRAPLVPSGQAELVLGVFAQCCFGGSKKPATSPSAMFS